MSAMAHKERAIPMRWHRRGNLLDSFRHAFDGLAYVVRAERNARVHLAVSLVVVLLGAWLRLSRIEWVFIIMAIALVFAGEMLNTVVELVIDIVAPNRNSLAKYAKDVAAGAILIAAIAAAATGLIILGPPLWERVSRVWIG
jgi:undecaprenol kinase